MLFHTYSIELHNVHQALEMRRGLRPVEFDGSPELGKRVAEHPERHYEKSSHAADRPDKDLAMPLPSNLGRTMHAIGGQEGAHKKDACGLRKGNANAAHGKDQKRSHGPWARGPATNAPDEAGGDGRNQGIREQHGVKRPKGHKVPDRCRKGDGEEGTDKHQLLVPGQNPEELAYAHWEDHAKEHGVDGVDANSNGNVQRLNDHRDESMPGRGIEGARGPQVWRGEGAC